MPASLLVANFDKTQSYDFTNSNSKIRLIAGTFSDTTSENGEPVELRFQTITKGTAVEIRESLRDVEYIFARSIRFHNDPTEQNSIWIYAASEGSEKERRSLVMTWQRTDTVQNQSDPLLDRTLTVVSDWSISRNGYWESTIANIINVSDTTFQTQNCHAAYDDIGGPPSINKGFHNTAGQIFDDGTAPGRIRRLSITFNADPASGKRWEKFWLGLKPPNISPATFVAHESFGNTTGNPDILGSANGAGSTAGSLNTLCGQIGDDGSFNNKLSVQIPSYNSVEEEQRGTYLILYRMKTENSGASFRTAMFQSWDVISNAGALADTYQDVFVESDEWRMYEMGVVQIPPEGYRSARRIIYEEFTQLRLGIATERLAGTGNLFIDYLAWIPQEHALSISNLKATQNVPANIVTDEDDKIYGYTTKYGAPFEKYVHEISASNWVWPADPSQYSILVTAADMADGDGDHPLDKEPIVEFWIVPRYFSYNAD